MSLPLVMMFSSKAQFRESIHCFPLWILTLCVASVAFIPVQGEYRLIGSSQSIVAALGEDVILPCHVEPAYNIQALAVEWSDPDLKPDPSDRLSRVEFVHFYRNYLDVHHMMIPSYVGRTELFRNELKRGNASLRIRNVTLNDAGRYRCFIPKLRSDAVLQLIVDENIDRTWTEAPQIPSDEQTPDPKNGTDVDLGGRSHTPLVIVVVGVVGVIVILTALGVYLFIKRRHKETVKYKAAPNTLQPA